MKTNDHIEQEKTLTNRQKIAVVGMFLGVFAVGLDSFIISPLLPPMASSLNGSPRDVAIGVTTYAIAYAVGAPLLAPMGDRYNPKIIATLGIVIFATSTIATSFQNTLTGFYVVRAIAGIGGAMYTPNIQAYISRRYEASLRAKLIGIVMAGLSASIVLGIPIGSWAASILSWRQVFPAIAAIGLTAGFILITTGSKYETSGVDSSVDRSVATYVKALSRSEVKYALGSTLAWMTAFYGVYTFLGSFLQERLSITVAEVGMYLMVYGIGNFAATFSAGWVNSRIGSGPRSVAIFGALNIGSVIVLTTMPLSPIVVMTIFLVWAASQGYAVTALIGIAAGSAPAQASTVLALNSSCIYVGLALGSAVFGALLSHGSLIGMGVPAAILTILSILSAAATRR